MFGIIRLSLTEMVLVRNGVRRSGRKVMQARLGLKVSICSAARHYLVLQEGRERDGTLNAYEIVPNEGSMLHIMPWYSSRRGRAGVQHKCTYGAMRIVLR